MVKGVEVIHHTLCWRTMNWIMLSTYHILWVIVSCGVLVQASVHQCPHRYKGYLQPQYYVFDHPAPRMNYLSC